MGSTNFTFVVASRACYIEPRFLFRKSAVDPPKCVYWLPIDHSVYGLSQWKTTLQCNIVCHWLNPYKEWSLWIVKKRLVSISIQALYVFCFWIMKYVCRFVPHYHLNGWFVVTAADYCTYKTWICLVIGSTSHHVTLLRYFSEQDSL